jgi:hypothetical protein
MASVVAIPLVANAEPMLLTEAQMESVSAAALIEVSPSINLVLGNVLVQTNITTQVGNAIALAISTCGICIGGGPSAASVANAINVNAGFQFRR